MSAAPPPPPVTPNAPVSPEAGAWAAPNPEHMFVKRDTTDRVIGDGHGVDAIDFLVSRGAQIVWQDPEAESRHQQERARKAATHHAKKSPPTTQTAAPVRPEATEQRAPRQQKPSKGEAVVYTGEWHVGEPELPVHLKNATGELLELLRPNHKEAERRPFYSDKYKVFDAEGNQLFNKTTKQPLDVRTMRASDELLATMKDINGKSLAKDRHFERNTSVGKSVDHMRDVIRGKIANRFDAKYYTTMGESVENAHENERVIKATSSGPDNEERILFADFINGRWQNVDGNPLSPGEIARWEAQMKIAKTNPALYQGRAAYEIGKLAEAGQADGWLRIVNIMYNHLGFDVDEIKKVTIGLQFMKKATYLTFKHRGLEHPPMYVKDPATGLDLETPLLDRFKRPIIDEETFAPKTEKTILKNAKDEPIKDRTRLVFGELKLMDYFAELTDKFAPHQMIFGPADVAEFSRAVDEQAKVLDKAYWSPEQRGRRNPPKPGKRDYRVASYCLHKAIGAMQASRMGSTSDPTAEESRAQYMFEGGAAGQYAPRLSGASESSRLWGQSAKTIDRVARLFPVLAEGNRKDYGVLSERDGLNDPDADY